MTHQRACPQATATDLRSTPCARSSCSCMVFKAVILQSMAPQFLHNSLPCLLACPLRHPHPFSSNIVQ